MRSKSVRRLTNLGAAPPIIQGLEERRLLSGAAVDAPGGIAALHDLSISAAPFISQPPQFTSPNQKVIPIGINAPFLVTAVGNPMPSLSVSGNFPGGLHFQDNGNGTATISGITPSNSVGVYMFTIIAANGTMPNAMLNFTLTIAAPSFGKSNGMVMGMGTGGADTGSVAVSGRNVVFTIDGQMQSYPMGKVHGVMLNLGAGNDSLSLGAGVPAISLSGGSGADTIMANNSDADTISGGGGADQIIGGAPRSMLEGGGGNDVITATSAGVTLVGGGGGDTLTGAGNSMLTGGAGDDTFLDYGTSGDTIDGGSGLNFAQNNPNDSMTNVFQVIDPDPSTVSSAPPAQSSPAPAPGNANVTASILSGTLTIIGTSSADSISVTSDGTNLIVASSGSNIGSFLLADATGISIKGQAGSDTIAIDSSVTLPATIKGGGGADSITGGGGDNVLVGGAGSDTLTGGGGINLLVAGDLETFSSTSGGNDMLIGGSGTNIADFSYRTDNLKLTNDGLPDSGDASLGETITIMPGVTDLWGGTGNDTIIGTVGSEFLSGGNGADSIQGGGTDDLIVGGLGKDTVAVAAEPVTLYLLDGKADKYSGVNDTDEDILSLDSIDTSF